MAYFKISSKQKKKWEKKNWFNNGDKKINRNREWERKREMNNR